MNLKLFSMLPPLATFIIHNMLFFHVFHLYLSHQMAIFFHVNPHRIFSFFCCQPTLHLLREIEDECPKKRVIQEISMQISGRKKNVQDLNNFLSLVFYFFLCPFKLFVFIDKPRKIASSNWFSRDWTNFTFYFRKQLIFSLESRAWSQKHANCERKKCFFLQDEHKKSHQFLLIAIHKEIKSLNLNHKFLLTLP